MRIRRNSNSPLSSLENSPPFEDSTGSLTIVNAHMTDTEIDCVKEDAKHAQKTETNDTVLENYTMHLKAVEEYSLDNSDLVLANNRSSSTEPHADLQPKEE